MYDLGLRPDRQHQKSRAGSRRGHGQATTPTATPRSTTRWRGWCRSSRSATLWSTGTATSGPRVPTIGPPPLRYTECRLAPLGDGAHWRDRRRDRRLDPRTTTAATRSRSCSRRASRTCSSTASQGIAVGMATNIPPHNLGEVIDAAIHVLDHPESRPDDLMKFVKGPDFPTGAFDPRPRRASSTLIAQGAGRSRCEPSPRSRKVGAVRIRIVVTEIPYQTSVEVIGTEDRRARSSPATSTGIAGRPKRVRQAITTELVIDA